VALPGPWQRSTRLPFGHRLGLDVVVHRVAAVAKRPRSAASCCRRIVGHPPVGVRLNEVGAPHSIDHVPTGQAAGSNHADLLEVALLPLAPVGECHLVERECLERIWTGEIREDRSGCPFGPRPRWPSASSTSVRKWAHDNGARQRTYIVAPLVTGDRAGASCPARAAWRCLPGDRAWS